MLLFGPTGAGKSSLFNALAGRYASRVGVLRPTTREVVVLVRPEEREAALGEGTGLGRIEPQRVQLIEDPEGPTGLVLLDAPDLDSVEQANRELAERLVEAADLGIFVTSAVRYADRVPWDTLARVRERGLPLIVVLNRMPSVLGRCAEHRRRRATAAHRRRDRRPRARGTGDRHRASGPGDDRRRLGGGRTRSTGKAPRCRNGRGHAGAGAACPDRRRPRRRPRPTDAGTRR